MQNHLKFQEHLHQMPFSDSYKNTMVSVSTPSSVTAAVSEIVPDTETLGKETSTAGAMVAALGSYSRFLFKFAIKKVYF